MSFYQFQNKNLKKPWCQTDHTNRQSSLLADEFCEGTTRETRIVNSFQRREHLLRGSHAMRSRRGRNIESSPFKTNYSQLTLKTVNVRRISRAFSSWRSQAPIILSVVAGANFNTSRLQWLGDSNTNNKSIEFYQRHDMPPARLTLRLETQLIHKERARTRSACKNVTRRKLAWGVLVHASIQIAPRRIAIHPCWEQVDLSYKLRTKNNERKCIFTTHGHGLVSK